MTAAEIIKKVKQIEYKSKKRTNSLLLGEYHSSFKGMGMTFAEVRPYQYGDDVRKLDWNKTARFNEAFVKTFQEERELTLMLLVDVSKSLDFGTIKQTKRETVAEICATLGFSAITNNDKVGLILFSNRIEKVIPPKKGRSTVLRIIREIVDCQPKQEVSDFNGAFDFLLKTLKRKSIVFVLSDFEGLKVETPLKITTKKHDLNCLRIYDEKEKTFPNIGWIQVEDLETQSKKWINTSSATVRNEVFLSYEQLEKNMSELSGKYNFNYRSIRADEDYTKPLLSIFKNHHKKI